MIWDLPSLRSGSLLRGWGERYQRNWWANAAFNNGVYGPDIQRITNDSHRAVIFSRSSSSRWTDQMQYGLHSFEFISSSAGAACNTPTSSNLGAYQGYQYNYLAPFSVRYISCTTTGSIFDARPAISTTGIDINAVTPYSTYSDLGTYISQMQGYSTRQSNAELELYFDAYASPDGPQIN